MTGQFQLERLLKKNVTAVVKRIVQFFTNNCWPLMVLVSMLAILLYFASYFLLIERVAGEWTSTGVIGRPAGKGSGRPGLEKDAFRISFFKPVILIDQWLRPKHWVWDGTEPAPDWVTKDPGW